MSRLNVDQIYTRTGTGSPAIREMPAFKALQGTTQTGVGSGSVLVDVDTIVFDTNNWFNTSTHRYVPQIAGYYFFRGFVILQVTTSVTSQQVQLRKNGVLFSRTIQRATSSSTNYFVETCGAVYLNGSTDYVEVWGLGSSASTNFLSDGTEATSGTLEGFLVRPD